MIPSRQSKCVACVGYHWMLHTEFSNARLFCLKIPTLDLHMLKSRMNSDGLICEWFNSHMIMFNLLNIGGCE